MRGKIAALMAAVTAAVGAAGAARWMRGRKSDDELDLEVRGPSGTRRRPTPAKGTAPAAAPAPAKGTAPAAAPAPAAEPAPGATVPTTGTVDDLTAIKGLGKVKAAKLVAAGVTSYAQIAAWTDEDIAEVGLACTTSPGQIKREDWVGQARALAEG